MEYLVNDIKVVNNSNDGEINLLKRKEEKLENKKIINENINDNINTDSVNVRDNK